MALATNSAFRHTIPANADGVIKKQKSPNHATSAIPLTRRNHEIQSINLLHCPLRGLHRPHHLRPRLRASHGPRRCRYAMTSPVKSVSFADTTKKPEAKSKKYESGTMNHKEIKKVLSGIPIPTEKAVKINITTTPLPTARPTSPSTIPKDD